LIKTDPLAGNWITEKEERTRHIILDANLSYRDPGRGPHLKKVIFRNDLTKQQALDLCTSTEGQVDLVTGILPEEVQQVVSSSYAKLVTSDGDEVVTGVFNRFQSDFDFDNYYFRSALNSALDRDEIVQEVYKGFATKVPALTPPWAYDFPEGLEPIAYDPAQSRKMLDQSNYPKERALKIAAFDEHKKLLNVITRQLQNVLSINIIPIVISRDEEVKWRRVVAEKKLNPGWDILLASANALFYEGTPAFFHREFFGYDGALRSCPELLEFDRRYQSMINEVAREHLLMAAKEVDRYVYQERLSLFLVVPQNLYAVNRDVDFQPYRTTFELAETQVAESHWSRRLNL
jgi:peptide/nickel transport system substrate-binding protein